MPVLARHEVCAGNGSPWEGAKLYGKMKKGPTKQVVAAYGVRARDGHPSEGAGPRFGVDEVSRRFDDGRMRRRVVDGCAK